MKMLVVDLLRLGDLLMHRPLYQAMKREHPDVELHILINSDAKVAEPILRQWFSEVHIFDRKQYQNACLDRSASLLSAVNQLSWQIEDLNQRHFDYVVNMTQNKLSGYLTDLIEAEEVYGLTIDNKDRSDFFSPWFRYLEDHVTLGGANVFHYNDALAGGLGLQMQPEDLRCRFDEEPEFQDEVRSLGLKTKGLVVQATSFDSRKEWDATSLGDALLAFQSLNHDSSITLIGAPFEADQIQSLYGQLQARGLHLQMALLSLGGVTALLNQSKCLLTVDTSIKHLAAGTSCKIVELALGSADVRKTGVYKDHSLIIEPKIECFPCAHRADGCERKTFECRQAIPGDLAGLALSHFYRGTLDGLHVLAEQTKDECAMSLVKTTPFGFWRKISCSPSDWSFEASRLLTMLSTQRLLDGSHKPMGTDVALHLIEEVYLLMGAIDSDRFSKWLKSIEADSFKKQTTIESMVHISRTLRKHHNPAECLEKMHQKLVTEIHVDEDPNLFDRVRRGMEIDWSTSKLVDNFDYLRQLDVALDHSFQKSEIQHRLIRYAKELSERRTR